MIPRYGIAKLMLHALLMPGFVLAQQSEQAQTGQQQVTEVLVSGRQQGPPLWEVSKDGHKLMLFGLPDVVPKKLQWDSAKVEVVLKDAQVILEPPGLGIESSVSIGPFKAIGLFRQYRRMRKLDDKRTLDELLDPELFLRITALQKLYGPRGESLHKLRPFLVAAELTRAAMDKVGLEGSGKISSRISKLVRKSQNNPRTVSSLVKGEVNPAGFLTELDETPWSAELGCMKSVLNTLEKDIRDRRERAISWSYGEMTEIYSRHYPDPAADCLAALLNNHMLGKLTDQSRALWLDNAEAVIAEHSVGFGMLNMNELVNSDGLLAQLEARGYAVRRP